MKKILSVLFIIVCGVIIIPMAINSPEPIAPEVISEASVDTQYQPILDVTQNSDNPQLALSNYLKSWAKENDFTVVQDKTKNVIITKKAKPGYEDAPSTILQSSNGKGMATALHVLTTTKYEGDLKAIFTMTDGTNMIGAENLNPAYLDSDYLINLSNDEKQYITNGSAGTTTYSVNKNLSWDTPKNDFAFEIAVRGFTGGDASDTGNPNALIFMSKFLANAKSQGVVLELASLNGGTTSTTIPNEATLVVVVNEFDGRRVQKLFNSSVETFKNASDSSEKNATFTLTPLEVVPEKVLSRADTNAIISYLYGIVDGVYSMSPNITDLIESSSNLGTAYSFTGNFTSSIVTTSFSEERNQELNVAHNKLFYLSGMNSTMKLSCPTWVQKPGSSLLSIMSDNYSEEENAAISNTPLHRGSECGWFAQKNPSTDIISMSVTSPEKYILKFLGD